MERRSGREELWTRDAQEEMEDVERQIQPILE